MDRVFEHAGTTFGFSSAGRVLTVVHLAYEEAFIRIISARRASAAEEAFYDQ
jgi:uncharacterized DUF497 family protein